MYRTSALLTLMVAPSAFASIEIASRNSSIGSWTSWNSSHFKDLKATFLPHGLDSQICLMILLYIADEPCGSVASPSKRSASKIVSTLQIACKWRLAQRNLEEMSQKHFSSTKGLMTYIP